MVRVGLLLLGCASLAFLIGPLVQVLAGPPSDSEVALRNTLAVQCAMEKASYLLLQSETKKAVEVLEENLSRVNGKAEYLKLLRKAYRSYVQELWLSNQTALAQQYLDRLSILDSTAASDPTLRPTAQNKSFTDSNPLPQNAAIEPVKVEPAGPADRVSVPVPASVKPVEAAVQQLPGPKPTTVRGKIEDPFDLSYENAKRSVTTTQNSQLSRSNLASAEDAYAKQQFRKAQEFFEKVHGAEPALVEPAKDRWIYCKLQCVVEELNQAASDVSRLPVLRNAVQESIAMNPAPKLAETARWLLTQIDDRQKGSGTPASAAEAATVQHQPRNAQGWQVAETANFRVFHNQTRDFADKAARIAEATRADMFRKWFGSSGDAWNPKCELYLHSTANDYSRATGVPANSPGHSRIENDRVTGRIIGRRMDLHCDTPTLLQAVLPHETTHVVLAGQFGRHAVPRWADEGMAVLSEPNDKIDQHRRNLLKNRQDGQLFSVRELMTLQDYPQPKRIGAFYAQSVVLVEFMSKIRGPQVFSNFLRDGLNEGYEVAMRKHYNVRDFNDLQDRWTQACMGTEVNTAGYMGEMK